MNWVRVAATSQLGESEALGVLVEGHPVAVYRSGGEFFATDDVCTHAYALLSDGFVEDGCIECPLHQARFDLRTGKVLCEPATEDLKTYPVRVEDDSIYVGI